MAGLDWRTGMSFTTHVNDTTLHDKYGVSRVSGERPAMDGRAGGWKSSRRLARDGFAIVTNAGRDE